MEENSKDKRLDLMVGKKLLYVHGFGSSGASGSAKGLRILLPKATVISPDLPVHPAEAMELLHQICETEKPDLIIGSSMGGMYSEMLYGFDRLLVNPAFQIADTMSEHNMIGRVTFSNPRKDGMKDFLVNKTLQQEFREVSSHCFEKVNKDEQRRVYALYGIHDVLVHTFDLFTEHYTQAIRFNGAHFLNDHAWVHCVLPVIQWIDDRQEGRDLLRLDELEERFRLCFGGDDDGRALRGGGGQGAVKRRAVEHRIDEQMDVRRDEALRGDGGHHVENQIAMAHDGAFRGGCRSGRVHDDARVLGGDIDRVESVALFEKRLERNELRRVFNGDDGEVIPSVDSGEGLFVVFVLDNQGVWFDGVENRHEGIGLEPWVDRHDDAADFDERPIDEIVFEGVRQADGDGRTVGFRGFLQSCGEFFTERVRFGVGEPFVKADGCELVRGGLEGVVPEFTGGFEIVGKHFRMWVEVAVDCEKRMVCVWD